MLLFATMIDDKKKIYVTQPFLPPLSEFIPYLEKIWETKWLTNAGPFHEKFEDALVRYLDVSQLALFANGTIALVTALQTLRIAGEVITTPFSFAATTHSLFWNNITPVFVDVNPNNCNINPEKIEAAITPRTRAILAVHCYGNPCDVDKIQYIADTYGLKVIYDAAHAFGVKYRGISLLNHGDLSVLSFHATKVFNTFEGGAIVCADAKIKQRINYLKNFGFADEVTVMAPGINGKMNEIQAAFGLLQLEYVQEAIERRRKIDENYRRVLANVAGIYCLSEPDKTERNYAYFPILVGEDFPLSRDHLYAKFREQNIFVRRYFHPLISDMPMYRGLPSAAPGNLLEAKKVASQVLCLPIYPALELDDQNRVIELIMRYK